MIGVSCILPHVLVCLLVRSAFVLVCCAFRFRKLEIKLLTASHVCALLWYHRRSNESFNAIDVLFDTQDERRVTGSGRDLVRGWGDGCSLLLVLHPYCQRRSSERASGHLGMCSVLIDCVRCLAALLCICLILILNILLLDILLAIVVRAVSFLIFFAQRCVQ